MVNGYLGIDSIVKKNDLIFVDTCSLNSYFGCSSSDLLFSERKSFYETKSLVHNFWLNLIFSKEDKGKILVTRPIYDEIITEPPEPYKKTIKKYSQIRGKSWLESMRTFNKSRKLYHKLKLVLEEDKRIFEDNPLEKDPILDFIMPYVTKVNDSAQKQNKDNLSEADVQLFLTVFRKSLDKKVALISNDSGIFKLWGEFVKDFPSVKYYFDFYFFQKGNEFEKKEC